MLIAVAGMSHRSAPVEVRERVAFAPCAARSFLGRLREEPLVSEAVLLSTCNRTELYAVVEDESARDRLLGLLAEDRGLEPGSFRRDTYWYTDAEAVRHLYRVSASLDSMVVGEAQILGQVRDAYRMATEERCTGPVLNRLFHTSLRVGKRVRAETGIGDSSLSVPHVAAKLAGEVFGSLEGRRALVLGAGEMSELLVRHLRDRGVSELRIANRTRERAERLAGLFGGRAIDLADLPRELAAADIVVSSTGSGEWVIRGPEVSAALEAREEPLFLIDIAVPRDIDPVVQSIEGAFLYDIDDLQAVVERNAEDRREAAAAAEEMIGPAVVEFMSWLSTLHVAPLIKELRDGAERIRRHEVSRTLKKMNLSPEQEEAVEKMSRSIVNKLLHGPISEIKARAEAGDPLDSAEVRRRLLALRGPGMELHRSREP
ncbi:glutamyl-tRNA reductase [Rubrobacter xylanophilus]|uniref:Glutamyl-tRNA reductase n=1 Tax=Rubrobacter xylanophilus TaxID=49319 RepID=A0A510HJE3_9ACTN|nr:glutamyl-tRNA reductase [Rubrobacter xylanophilus]BBL79375.1 glutamyl-tRNA reductase [Rubrobacter xylanophilus]